ncbi:hypothetical protein BJV77DRAFT_137056 [Russula vinacea]|nr:hypothetical protein BJV77DRAFT_137056 [Russula vinacea]
MIPPLGFSSCPPFLQRHLCSPRRSKANTASHSSVDQYPLSPHSPPMSIVTRPSHSHSHPPAPTPTSPISRLPVELLTRIFTHVPRIEFEEFLQSVQTLVQTTPPPKPTWMAITQVCQHWRVITANCKDFWSYIPLQTSPHWVNESLSRSYPCPISFSVDFSTALRPEWYRSAVLSALKAVSRARQVHLQGSAVTTSEFRREVLRLLDVYSAPALEAFSVRGQTPRDSVTLSDNIFHCCVATALCSLTLAYCNVYPSSPLFRAPLLSLRLVNCLVEFPLKVLSFLPHLRTLVLENTYGTHIENSSKVLRLPQLQQVELTNASDIIAFLLQGILVPSSSFLSITCTDYVDIEEPLDDLALLRTVTSNLSPVLSTYLERARGEGYNYPLLEIASPTSTAKKTLVLLDPVGPWNTAASLFTHLGRHAQTH